MNLADLSIPSLVTDGFAAVLIGWAVVWGLTVPIRALFRLLGL